MKKIDYKNVISRIDSFKFMCYPPHYPIIDIWENNNNNEKIKEKIKNYFEKKQERELGIYINVPFCKRKCSFCFLDIMIYNQEAEKRFLYGIKNEIKLLNELKIKNHISNSLYLGGGTISILTNNGLRELFETIRNGINFSKNFQFSLETSPEFITEKNAEIFSRYGVNLVMMGIQSFNDDKNKKFNRFQKKENIEKAIRILKNKNIYVNLDIITGLTGTDEKEFIKEVISAVNLTPDMIHLNKFKPIYDETKKMEIEKLQKKGLTILAKSGYKILDEESGVIYPFVGNTQGDINFQTDASIISMGPNSIAHLYSSIRYKNYTNFNNYLLRTENNTLPIESFIEVDEYDEAVNYCLNNIHNNGVDLNKIKKLFTSKTYNKILKKLKKLYDNNFIKKQDNIYKTDGDWFEVTKGLYKNIYLSKEAKKNNFYEKHNNNRCNKKV